jgi:hypothetical protein
MLSENIIIQEIVNENTANFIIKLNKKIAVAEISLIDKEIGND